MAHLAAASEPTVLCEMVAPVDSDQTAATAVAVPAAAVVATAVAAAAVFAAVVAATAAVAPPVPRKTRSGPRQMTPRSSG